MLIFNFATKCYYELPKILIVGNIDLSIKTITDYGFFKWTICCYNSEIIRKECLFIVSDSIPQDWNGEIVPVKDFYSIINERKIKTLSTPSLSPYAPSNHTCGQCGGK